MAGKQQNSVGGGGGTCWTVENQKTVLGLQWRWKNDLTAQPCHKNPRPRHQPKPHLPTQKASPKNWGGGEAVGVEWGGLLKKKAEGGRLDRSVELNKGGEE